MNEWLDFLSQIGAQFDLDNKTLFTETPLSINKDKTYLTNLSHQSLLSIKGPDSANFLQGQITCDVNDLAQNICPQGAQCNLKGRVIGNFRIASTIDTETIFMRMHHSVVHKVFETLKKYSVFSKLELTNQSDQWQRFGIFGPKAAEILKAQTDLSLNINSTYHATDSLILLKLADERYECWVKNNNAKKLWLTLEAKCSLINSAYWSLLDIQAGWVEIQQTTSELFTPQALNLPFINAVNFKKGCYTGQEVVARLHYRGSLKKHLYRVSITADTPPKVCDRIMNDSGVKHGEIITTEPAAAGTYEALAMLPSNSACPISLAGSVKTIQRLSLPYAIPKAE